LIFEKKKRTMYPSIESQIIIEREFVMKKIVALLIAISMMLVFVGCSKTSTEIPLGGNLPSVSVDGLGKYKEVDFPEDTDNSNFVEAHLYYDEDSTIPFISTYRWNKDADSLEEEMEKLSNAYDIDEYKIIPWEEINIEKCGYYADSYELDGTYYYYEENILEDGDDFVSIEFYFKTEEVAIGNTGYYLWVPAGYTSYLDEDEKAHGTFFYGEYDYSYCLPGFWMAQQFSETYEALVWFWNEQFSEDNFPVSEETYNGWLEQAAQTGWTYSLCYDYYEAFGLKMDK